MPKLTAKQRAFVAEYLKDRNATQAAIRAGYSEKSARDAGYETLHRSHVAAEIARREAKLAEKCEVTAERVIRELALLGFSNIADYLKFPEKREPYIDLSALTRDQAAALSEVTVDTIHRSDDLPDVQRVKIRLSDKRAALELLGKHLGIFKEAETKVGITIVIDGQDARL